MDTRRNEMLNISEELKEYLLTDSSPKQLIIEEDPRIERVNLYMGDVNEEGYEAYCEEVTSGGDIMLYGNYADKDLDIAKYVDTRFLKERKYLYVSCEFYSNLDTGNIPTFFALAMHYLSPSGSGSGGVHYYYRKEDFLPKLLNSEPIRLVTRVETANIGKFTGLAVYCGGEGTRRFTGNYKISKIQMELSNVSYSIDELVNKYELPYNGPYNADNIELSLNNDNYEAESFSLTESLCSQDNIKFGLCESAHFEITVVDKDVNFRNRVLKPKIFVDNKTEIIKRVNFCPSSYNDSSSTGAKPTFWYYAASDIDSSGKATELLGLNRYIYVGFDVKMDSLEKVNLDGFDMSKVFFFFRSNCLKLDGSTGTFGTFSFKDENYHYECNHAFKNKFYSIDEMMEDFVHVDMIMPYNYRNEIINLVGIDSPLVHPLDIMAVQWKFADSNDGIIRDYPEGATISFTMTMKNKVLSFIDDLDEPRLPFDEYSRYVAHGTYEEFIKNNSEIPLGVFNVSEVKTSHTHDIIRKNLTCYDNILLLNQNAADWYTRYMWGVDTDVTSSGFEYARQIYSTYFNYANTIGMEKREYYTEEKIAEYSYDEFVLNGNSKDWGYYLGADYFASKLKYASVTVTGNISGRRLVVDRKNPNNETDVYIALNKVNDGYRMNIDATSRGLTTEGTIMVEEKILKDGNYTYNKYLCNAGDYFMVSDGCDEIHITMPICVEEQSRNTGKTTVNKLIDKITIYHINEDCKLINGSTRLMYYNYKQKNIFACDSSITGRDVVRSLLEVCGCFFRLSRDKSRPEFVYCKKSGLYPRNDLYPSDTLYPRESMSELLHMSKYIKFERDDYEVEDIGRIQIKKKDTSNAEKSICEWQYTGNPKAKNTYIIDDNIFYCASDMVYDYDRMPEVSNMLENMYNVISNMGYTPNTTVAKGLPWIECGDRIGLLTKTGGVESFVFRRTLKGIQSLKDTYESRGDEYIEAINDFGYSIYSFTQEDN